MNAHCCTAELIEYFLKLTAPITTVITLAAVFLNFALARAHRLVADRRPSVVATASMMAFFVGVYFLLHLRIGVVSIPNDHKRLAAEFLGAFLMIAGCIVNVLGRFSLGKNWANQATLYDDQTLVTDGVFSIARHPLYSSLIWMFYGASLEEKLLVKRFPKYIEYQKRTGMLFPKIF